MVAIILIIIVVIAGAVALVLSSRGSTTGTSTTTNSPSTSASSSVTQPPSSSTSTSSGAGKVSIMVMNATLDTADAQEAGDTVYVYFIDFANQGTVNRTISTFGFTLVATNGSSFGWKAVQAEQHPLSGQVLLPGRNASGQIAFEVPLTLTPTRLVYNYTLVPSKAYSVIVNNIPAPTLWISAFAHSANAVVTGPSASDLATPVYQIQNESGNYIYTGQTLVITMTVGGITASPAITITGISVSNPGVTIVKVDPSIPATIPANGDLKFTITIMAPSSSDQGNLNFTVTEST
jgi:hypothetical protein